MQGGFFQREWAPSELESDPHINLLETIAAKESVLNLAHPGDLVRLHIDNRVACSYISKQGGTKSFSLCQEACSLWEESLRRNITLLTPHWIGTKENAMADFLSRNKVEHWEFGLRKDLFDWVVLEFGIFPTLDTFASRNTSQLPRYMSLFQDSLAVAQDALINRWDRVSYAFPPSPLMLKVLQKIQQEQISVILICPKWPSALWWPLVEEMSVQQMLQLPHYKEAVVQIYPDLPLPYLEPLVAVHVRSPALSQE